MKGYGHVESNYQDYRNMAFFSQSSFFWAQPRNVIFFTWQKIWNLYNIFELIHFMQNYKQETNTKKTCLFILLIQNNISQGKKNINTHKQHVERNICIELNFWVG